MMRNAVLLLLALLTLPVAAQRVNDVIVPRAAAPDIVVPVTGNAQGANGTFFRTDVNLINLRNAPQRVALYWLPQGTSGDATPAGFLDMNALSGVGSEDFVGQVLLRQGLGAIRFVAVTAGGAPDSNGLLHASSRIWTPRPDGAEGTMSQSFPAIVSGAAAQAAVKVLFGMRRSAQFRLNAGVMNPASTTQRFRVTALISGGTGTDTQVVEFDVPARSIHQVLMPGTSSGTVQVVIENITGGAGDWHGWASSVDNQSGDAWSQIAVAG